MHAVMTYAHVRVYSPKAPHKPFQCRHCQKDFPKKADRDRHEASVHRNQMEEPPHLWDCTFKGCTRRRGFTRKDNLLDHLRRVHNKSIPKRITRRNERALPGASSEISSDDFSR
jgi:hypothetical protein